MSTVFHRVAVLYYVSLENHYLIFIIVCSMYVMYIMYVCMSV